MVETVAFGALSGGIGAELSGGNFWEGALIGGMVAGLNHAMHKESSAPPPPEEDDWAIKIVNFLSGGAVDEARAILAFEATNPSFTDKIMFRTGIALQHSTAETFGAKGLGAWANYRGRGGMVNVRKIPTLKEQATQISKNLGKNSITLRTQKQQIRYDLVGKPHNGVDTPHKQIYNKNFINGVHRSTSRASKDAIGMTQQELRFIRKYIRK